MTPSTRRSEASPYSPDEQKRLIEVIFGYARQIEDLRDRESMLAVIAELGRDLVKADRCSIWLVDQAKQQLVTRLSHGVDPIRISLGEGYVGLCVSSGEVVRSNELAIGGTASVIDAKTGYETKNVLVVPMHSSQGEVIGAFQALNKDGGFLPDDGDLLKLAAAYSAGTLEAQKLRVKAEEARRLEYELDIARQVQQRMLPGAIEVSLGGCTVFGKCRSAYEVGGDYFTFFAANSDCLVSALGDVAGKGISAALMMASIQATLQGMITNAALPLREMVERLNQYIYETSLSSRYSTLCLMRFDKTTGILTTVNAGHCPLIVLRANGDMTSLDSDGPPVGLLPGLVFGEQHNRLASGDLVVCYSDGLSECHNKAEEMWPDDRFMSALKTLAGLSAEQAVGQLMAMADAFGDGAPQHDDMTVLCVRVS